MKRIVTAVMLSALAAGPAYAQTCATQAISKEGKPLAGAAKTSFVRAKTSYVKKCAKG